MNAITRWVLTAGLALGGLATAGCGGSEKAPLRTESPRQAASYLDESFKGANRTQQKNAAIASEAMRQGDYEKAVAALHTVRSSGNVSLQQGMAIHSSLITLERDLIQAADRGDPRAQKAYELLKRMNRN